MNRIILKIGMGLLILLYSISIIISIFNVSKGNYKKEYTSTLNAIIAVIGTILVAFFLYVFEAL